MSEPEQHAPRLPTLRVRRARIEEIRPLAERYAEDVRTAGVEEERDAPMPQGGIFWIATVGGTPVGYAAVALRPNGCVVGPVYAAPEHRRQGVGARLLAGIHEWAAGTGVPIVEISVAYGNDGGIAFLRSLGYEPRRTLMSLTPRSTG